MPELPEVETTVKGLNESVTGLTIVDTWTDYGSSFHAGKENIKNKNYFPIFRREVKGEKIVGAKRRGKNVLIHLSHGKTILIHMKMTGHLLYGAYRKNPKFEARNSKKVKNIKINNYWAHEKWIPNEENELLRDSFNKFIHLVFTLSNKKHLAFSDMRKFGKVSLLPTIKLQHLPEISHLGPEPLLPVFTLPVFRIAILKKSKGKIKQVLMDQSVIAGIGNIYSDEILWKSGVHPKSIVTKIRRPVLNKIFTSMKEILKKGIDFGGDSMSDYRNLVGERGRFQHTHNAYRLTGKSCKKSGCKGRIERMKIGGRSAHFCNRHQKLYV
ncbi:MAG: bifunctional DNA-formamidopyrimidine glycosylase/DNA-(apurinic or apyrimidinic site) lyase [Candidatus Taylorbacteria bacterium]